MLLSFCIVNTNGRDHLVRCLDAIQRTVPPHYDHEVVVLDNATRDGSVEAVRSRPEPIELIALEQRTGKGENDSTLLRRARGKYCLLLNEDAELCPGAVQALVEALDADPHAAAAGSQLLSPDGTPQPCAWRLPGVTTALASAVFLHRRLVVQSSGQPGSPRRVGWVQSSAMLVRRSAAEEVDYLDPAFFVYSDETDFCKRLSDRGWRILFVPDARAVHHEQLSSDRDAATRRIVEFHRNRDLYMRKHHGAAAAAAVRVLTAWAYFARAVAAIALPGHDPRRYFRHSFQALIPSHGEGIRQAAERLNRERQT